MYNLLNVVYTMHKIKYLFFPNLPHEIYFLQLTNIGFLSDSPAQTSKFTERTKLGRTISGSNGDY